MSAKNVQFSVGVHIMTVLGYFPESGLISTTLSQSVHAEPSFVRKVLAKLSAAGLVETSRGKNGCCQLGKGAEKITLLEIYRALETPKVFAVHDYPVTKTCPISRQHKSLLGEVLAETQSCFEQSLAKTRLSELVAATSSARKPASKPR